MRRERSGRRGKTVTVAGPFFLIRSDATALLKRMKKSCGGGGTLVAVRTATGESAFMFEIQGDHTERLIDLCSSLGYPAKRSGG